MKCIIKLLNVSQNKGIGMKGFKQILISTILLCMVNVVFAYQSDYRQSDYRDSQNDNSSRYRSYQPYRDQSTGHYYRSYQYQDDRNQDDRNVPGYMRNSDRAVYLANASLPTKVFVRWLKAEMQKNQIPAISIAVIKDYKVEWALGFGVTDIMAETQATDMTLFQAGSISKPVTAMAALKAVQDGKINLDGDINTALTSWKLPYNENTMLDKITLAKLLSHTAGINGSGYVGYAHGEKIPTLLEILDGKAPANSDPIQVISPPGENFEYSGGGYMIVQQLLEDVYHKPFAQIMNKLVLSQLGMSHSTFEQPLPNYLMEQIAKPYYPKYDSIEGGPHVYPEEAAAGLWTTPFDLAKFVISLQDSLRGDPHQILQQEYAKLMVKPELDHMGLGFFVSVNKYGKQIRDGEYFMHGGQNNGYRSLLIASETGGNGMIIMTNMAPDSYLVMTNKVKDSWAFMYSVEKKVADMEGWY